MISVACGIVGLYLILDSMYLASVADREYRICLIARYVGALMCGIYLVSLPIADMLAALGHTKFEDKQALSENDLEVRLMFGITVALFMWRDTFYRGLHWLQNNHEHWHQAIVTHFKIPQRRR